MHRIQENSLRRKIKTCRNSELSEVAQEICDNWGSWPISLFFDLKHRVLYGSIITEEWHVKLVVLSRSLTLYQKGFFSSTDSQLQLLRAGIPDVKIELKVAETVADNLRKNSYGHIESSLKTLRDFGSLACLDILEVADYDIYCSIQVDKIDSQLFGKVSNADFLCDSYDIPVRRMVSSLNLHLAGLLKETIVSIKNRNTTHELMSINWSTL